MAVEDKARDRVESGGFGEGAQRRIRLSDLQGSHHFFVVPDQQPGAAADCRRPQLPGAAEEQLEQLAVGGAVLLQVDGENLPAPGDEQLAHPFESSQGGVSLHGVLRRAADLPFFEPSLRKELLRPLATRSAGAVVAPLDSSCHGSLFRS